MRVHSASLEVLTAGSAADEAGERPESEAATAVSRVAGMDALRKAVDRVYEPTRRATAWDPVESIRPFLRRVENIGENA